MKKRATGLTQRERTKALGDWGERTAATVLKRAGFSRIHDLNAHRFNHPFGDILAERKGRRFLIGVRTRNKLSAGGVLNAAYNICRKGAELAALAALYRAEPAWVTAQVDVEAQRYSCFFGTMAEITAAKVRYSVVMTEEATRGYECLALNRKNRHIDPAWTNRKTR